MWKSFLIGLVLVGVPAAGSADPVREQRIVVSKDLDLSTRQGVRTLERRIADACGDASTADLAAMNAVFACRADAPARAEAAGQRYVLAHRPTPRTVELAANGSH